MSKKFGKKTEVKDAIEDIAAQVEAIAEPAEEAPAEAVPVVAAEKSYKVADGHSIAALSRILAPGDPVTLAHFGSSQESFDKHIAAGHIVEA